MSIVEAIRIEIPIETIDETEPELSNITKKLGKVEGASKSAEDAIQNAGKKVSKFDKSAEKSQRSLLKWAKEKYEVLLEAKERITPVLTTLGGNIKNFAGKTWNVTMKAVDLATAPIRGVINLLKNPIFQVGAVLGVSIGMKDTIDTYKNFEAAMSQVSAISGAKGADLEKLNEKAKEMGASTKFTATEAAEGFNYMAMAGWKTKDMLSGIEGIMNLAAASGEDLATTSDIVTDALTAFNLKAKDSTHFADVLAVASSNANTNVGMMGETFKYVAPVAGTLGINAEDTALAIGLMANSGIKASQAGTALRSILTRLSTDAGASSKSLGALGILTKQLGVQFYDSKGKVRELKDILVDTRGAWSKLTVEEQANYAKKIAGQEAQAGFLAIMNAEQKDFDKLADSIKNADGAAQEMADTMLDNLEGSITLFQSALDGVKLSFGERLSPYVRGIADWLTDMMPDIESALNGMMDSVDRKVARFQEKFREISGTADWQDADFFGKAVIAWDEFIVNPFSEWWESTGKAKIAGIAGDFGSVLGSGLNAGIMTLLGFDVSDSINEGENIGRSFAKGFADGFDFAEISSKLWEGLGNIMKNAGKLLPGGESADLSSLLSAAMLAKMAGPLISVGSSVASLGAGSGGTSLAGTLLGSASAGTGLAGLGANTAISLGAGNLAGGASLSAGALSAVGLGSIAGGVVGGAALISGGRDIYNAVNADNLEEQDAYAESAAWKIGGVASGAAIGAGVGSVVPVLGTAVGGLIGAGVGGIVGFVQGNKAMEEYEEKLELARQETEKAQKVFAATGHSIEDVRFETESLTNAMNDSSISAENLGLMFQEAVSEKLRSSFGDISLSLAEIRDVADDIVFDKQKKNITEFTEAVQNSESSFKTLQGSMSNLDKKNWEVGLGMKLDKADKQSYRQAVNSYVKSAKDYVENQHYEATLSMKLLLGKKDEGYKDGLDKMYSEMQEKIKKWDSKLETRIKVALKDGVIDVDEEKEIARLQKKITNITSKVSSAQEEASFASLKVRYSGSDLDAESFASLQEEIQANVESMTGNYDSALQVSLTNLQLQLDEGAINQDTYDKMYQKIADGYNKQITSLQDRAQDFQLDSIATAFKSELEGILPDIEGTTSEKLKEAMNHALAIEPDAIQWNPEDITKWFGLGELDTVTQDAIGSMLQNTALSVPSSVSASLQQNAQAQFQQLFNDASMSAPFLAAGNTYGTTMTTGITDGIRAGSPMLRSAAETSVNTAFATPFSVSANINVTPTYNVTSPFKPPQLAGEQTPVTPKQHAAGGMISGKQLSWLAEEGYPEVVIPFNPGRRKRALELYKQTGRMLGVSEHADGGFVGSGIPDMFDSAVDNGEAEQPVSYSPMDSGNNQSFGQSANIQISINMTPEFNITSSGEQSEEGIVQVIRRHIAEIADELGGEIASRLEYVFSNMPMEEV